jgi:hypothetical protein
MLKRAPNANSWLAKGTDWTDAQGLLKIGALANKGLYGVYVLWVAVCLCVWIVCVYKQ